MNPARSTGPAVFVGDWAIAQLWMFWVAPIVGGILGGALYATIFESGITKPERREVSQGRAALAARKGE